MKSLENTWRVIPERFCGGDSLRRGATSSVCTFTSILWISRVFGVLVFGNIQLYLAYFCGIRLNQIETVRIESNWIEFIFYLSTEHFIHEYTVVVMWIHSLSQSRVMDLARVVSTRTSCSAERAVANHDSHVSSTILCWVLSALLSCIYKGKGKCNVDLFSASTRSVSKALRYSMDCQGIIQFYLHTLCFIRKRNELHLPVPSQPQPVLIYRPQRDGRLSRP